MPFAITVFATKCGSNYSSNDAVLLKIEFNTGIIKFVPETYDQI